MRGKYILVLVVSVCCGLFTNAVLRAQIPRYGPKTLETATNTLNALMNMSDRPVPPSVLQRAQGLVIVPEMTKLELVANGRRGKGIAVVRGEDGNWRPPSFLTMAGGTIEGQLESGAVDVILVFNTMESVRRLYNEKLTLGMDAVTQAGPVGGQGKAAASGDEPADIFAYARGGSSFAGSKIEGAVIEIDSAASRNYYRSAAQSPDGKPTVSNPQLPLPAAQFLAALGTYQDADSNSSQPASARIAGGANAVRENAAMVQDAGSQDATSRNATSRNENSPETPSRDSRRGTDGDIAESDNSLEATRRQLATAAQNLGSLLDESWRQYLALPRGVFTGEGVPTAESLRRSLRRFEAVADESKYSVLWQRREFQQTYRGLRQYCQQIDSVGTENSGSSGTAGSEDGRKQATRQ